MLNHSNLQRETTIRGYKLEEKFISKKNEVYRGTHQNSPNSTVVIKKYLQNLQNLKKEVFYLKTLHENRVSVPQIYHIGSDYVIMEFLHGKTLLEVMEEMEENDLHSRRPQWKYFKNQQELINQLLEWLKNFYQISKEINGKQTLLKDIHLRNFIITNKIYGIDFENCHEGEIEEDIGKLSAFILTYDPSWTSWKQNFVKELVMKAVEKLHLSEKRLEEEINQELLNIYKRRKNIDMENRKLFYI